MHLDRIRPRAEATCHDIVRTHACTAGTTRCARCLAVYVKAGGGGDFADEIGHGDLDVELDDVGDGVDLVVDEVVAEGHHAWAG